MAINYEAAIYKVPDAAHATEYQLSTLNGLIDRRRYQFVGGEAKKGRGKAADLTLSDIMCIAVAKAVSETGMLPALAWEAGKTFAYSSGGATGPNTGFRLPSHLFAEGATMLICRPATGETKIINVMFDARMMDVFSEFENLDPMTSVVLPLNGLHARVLQRLGIDPRDHEN